MEPEIWNTDEQEQDLWETDPARAARLAYLHVQCLWHDQVVRGEYRGIPTVERAPMDPAETAVHRVVEPDSQAGVYAVPSDIRRRFVQLCA